MSPNDRRVGWVVMPLLLVGAIAVASLPLVAGLVVSALIPSVGALRVDSGWALLHLLWIYPVIYVVATIVEPLEKVAIISGTPRVVAKTASSAVFLVVLTGLLLVFFDSWIGAAIAAATGGLMLWAFVKILPTKPAPARDATAERDDDREP